MATRVIEQIKDPAAKRECDWCSSSKVMVVRRWEEDDRYPVLKCLFCEHETIYTGIE